MRHNPALTPLWNREKVIKIIMMYLEIDKLKSAFLSALNYDKTIFNH
jgi:hypothetical protein